MTGKHYKLHKAWRRLAPGQLQHDSGLIVDRDSESGWVVRKSTRDIWQAHELARGVNFDDLHNRLKRLLHEAVEWDSNPRNG